MTFSEIQSDVMDRLNLTSSDAQTRIGKAINRKYKQVTTSVGLVTARRTEVQKNCTPGVRTLTFTGVEKIINVIDKASGTNRILKEITYEEMEARAPQTSDTAYHYAIANLAANTTTILLDVSPVTAFTLYAEGHATAGTLSGTQEPAFSESFHDVLSEGVLVDEYRKLEKADYMKASAAIYETRMSELRMWIAKSSYLDLTQGGAKQRLTNSSVTGGGSGTAVNGAASYTQTGLITFQRAPSAPFAVTGATSAVVTNLDADKLDGQHGSYYQDATNLNAGNIPLGRFGLGTTNVILSTVAANQNNWAPGIAGDTTIFWSGAANITVTGFTSGTSGQMLVFRNTGSFIATFSHNSGSSSAGNKLFNIATSAGTPVAPGGIAIFQYDATQWRLIVHEQGAWITPTFAAGSYTGSGAMTWVVASAATQRYRLIGRTITAAFVIVGTVGGVPADTLQIGSAAYGGFTAAAGGDVSTGMGFISDAGVNTTGAAQVNSGGALIRVLRTNLAAWTAGTASISGQLTFEVT